MADTTTTTPSGSGAALVVLSALVFVSPWPFGSVHPVAQWLIAQVCLLTVLGITILRLCRGHGIEIPELAFPAVGICLLGAAQLIPLPHGLHALVAPGSAALWHPDVPSAANVLGSGARPVSIWPAATRQAVALGIGLTGLGVLAMPALRERRWALRAAIIAVTSGALVAAYGLVARAMFGDKLYGVFTVPTVAPFGPFVNKNHFAGYVEMAALLALGLATGLSDESRRGPGLLGWTESSHASRVVVAYGIVALLSLSVLVSLSRGGAVSLAFGMAAFVAWHPSLRQSTALWRHRILGGLAVVALAAAVVAVLPPEARQRLRMIGKGTADASTAYRARTWRDSLRLTAGSPLVGYGLGSFADAFPRVKTAASDVRVEHAENDYLEILCDSGGIGLTLAAALLGILVFRRSKSGGSRRDGVRLKEGLCAGAAAGTVAMCVHSALDFNLHITSNASLCVLLAAFVASGRTGVKTAQPGVLTVLLACAASLGLASWLPARDLQVGGRVIAATREVSSPLRLLEARASLSEHLRGRPADAPAWVWLGWVAGSQGQWGEASALASYGAGLDPLRERLQEEAARLRNPTVQ